MPDAETEHAGRVCIAAVDPVSGKTIEVEISHRRMHTVAIRSLGHAAECAFLVPYTLQHPGAIFEGIRLEEDEDRRNAGWYCYCSVPECSYNEDGVPQSAYPGQVFLVFVNARRVAYNWRWAKADADSPQWPVDYATRFTRRAL